MMRGMLENQPDHDKVDDDIHIAGLEVTQPGNGVSHSLLFVALGFRIILCDLSGHDEHVLAHERDAQVGGAYWTPSRILFLTRNRC